MKIYTSLLIILFVVICNAQSSTHDKSNLVKYVNPFIGTARTTTISGLKYGNGSEQNAQVIPAVTVPFGMTNWTPQTKNTEKKCISPYYYRDSIITGFRGSHWLSGSCTQDYGSFTIMPISGKLICNPAKRGSRFHHQNEIASVDYYQVGLEDYNITAEMSASTRCGIFRFTFNKDGEAHLVINPNSDNGEGSVKIFPDRGEVVGSNPVHRIYQGWGKPAGFSGHFVVKIRKVIDEFGVYSNDEKFPDVISINNKPNIGAYLSFRVKKGEQICIKVGTSFVSQEQAKKNLDSEIPSFDFDLVRKNLKNTWNNLLSKIMVEGRNTDNKVKFYTAMYHSFQQPRIYNDVDGSYPRFDGNARTDTVRSGNYYCDFSLWDTYRALHPLYNLIIPEQNADMIRSILTMAKAGGWLPIFPCWNSYTAAMIGDHAVAVIADAFINGALKLTDEDYKFLKRNASETPAFKDYLDGKGRRALSSYMKYGYIPLDDSVKEAFHKNEQVSRTLEYAFDDFALAQIAKKMGKEDDYNYFAKRSLNYRNVFDQTIQNMNGRFADGIFAKQFVKDKPASFITEGTPWQYNWYVPQDIEGLIQLMGGKEIFNKNLDSFFENGQYWHGNEPSHQISFLYNYSGQPWKTQKIVSEIMKEEYGIGPGGLSGNDDAGQMSAWYVLAAVGFYPVNPVSGQFVFGLPLFEKILLHLENGKTFSIVAKNISRNNIYINSSKLNGRSYSKNYISNIDIIKGGELIVEMSNIPNYKKGTEADDFPFSFSNRRNGDLDRKKQ